MKWGLITDEVNPPTVEYRSATTLQMKMYMISVFSAAYKRLYNKDCPAWPL